MLFELILLLIASAAVIFVALLVCLAGSVSRALKLTFVLITSSLIFWQATVVISGNVTTNLLLWNNLTFWGPTLALLGSYFFLYQIEIRNTISAGRPGVGWIVALIVAAGMQFIALFSGSIFTGVTYDAVSGSYSYARSSFYVLYILGVVLLMTTILARLIVSYHRSKAETDTRRAFRVVSITIASAMLFGFVTNAIIPLLTKSDDYLALGLLSMDIFASGLALSIVRHRFLDIRFIIARALAYSASLIVLATLYITTIFVVARLLFGIDINLGVQITLVVMTVIASLTFNKIKTFFAKWTNRLFYQDAYDPQVFFDDFNGALVSTIDLNKLLVNATTVIEKYIKAEYCVVGIKDPSPLGYRVFGAKRKLYPEKEVDIVRSITPHIYGSVIVVDNLSAAYENLKRLLVKNDVSLLVRLTQEVNKDKDDLGYIVLGPKKSGSPYSNLDIKVLETAASGLILAIQNAMRFEEIQQFNITLQEKIKDATQKLRQKNERLRQLDQTKDDFISMASHQLRTPLTSVKGYVSMVLDGDAGPINATQRKLLTQAFLSSQRMVYLISDLLNVSRLKTGKFVIEPVESQLDKVIEEEISQLTETAKNRGLKLKYHKPDHFPTLMIDETKIRQVIMNFVDNAIYYTPSGGTIDVYLEDKGESVEFRVVDTGIGVPKHEQHHLFTKFYRAKNAKNARPDGTGLGIFMAKKVIIAQGGAVIFKSTEGKGSTFGFTFPKAKLLPKLSPKAEQSAAA